MFGAYARAALAVPIAVLVGGIVEYALPFFLPLLGSESTMLYRTTCCHSSRRAARSVSPSLS